MLVRHGHDVGRMCGSCLFQELGSRLTQTVGIDVGPAQLLLKPRELDEKGLPTLLEYLGIELSVDIYIGQAIEPVPASAHIELERLLGVLADRTVIQELAIQFRVELVELPVGKLDGPQGLADRVVHRLTPYGRAVTVPVVAPVIDVTFLAFADQGLAAYAAGE